MQAETSSLTFMKRAVRLCLIFVDTLFIFSTGINNQESVKRVPYKNASKTVHSTTSTVTYLSKGKPTGVSLRCMSLNVIFSKICLLHLLMTT